MPIPVISQLLALGKKEAAALKQIMIDAAYAAIGQVTPEQKAIALQKIQGLIAPILTAVTIEDKSPSILATVVDTLEKIFLPGAKDISKSIMDTLENSKWITKEMRNHIDGLFNDTSIKSPIMYLVLPMFVVMEYVKNLMQAMSGLGVQNLNFKMRPNLVSGSDVLRAAFIDPKMNAKVREIFAKNGIPEDIIDLVFKANYALYDITTVRDLFLREEIDVNKVYERMREMGFTDVRIEEIMKTWNYIPPVQDIITMAVREAFSPQQIQELGLDMDFPEEVAVQAKKQGLSEYWSLKYWEAHWKLPSIEEGFEMFHRGKITEGQLRGLLKALDYSPVWHDHFMAISYNTPTRVDVRRMFELGVINIEQVKQFHLDMGYSPEVSEMLTKWVEIEYNSETRKLSESQLMQEYFDGFIESDELKRMLALFGYDTERINMMIAVASYKRAYAKQSARIDALHKLYLSGQYSDGEVRAELDEFKIDPMRIDELLDLWSLQYKAGLKLPTRSELDKALKAGLINSSEYSIEMLRNGYSEKYINLFIRLMQVE
jgi:hypothetical protein